MQTRRLWAGHAWAGHVRGAGCVAQVQLLMLLLLLLMPLLTGQCQTVAVEVKAGPRWTACRCWTAHVLSAAGVVVAVAVVAGD